MRTPDIEHARELLAELSGGRFAIDLFDSQPGGGLEDAPEEIMLEIDPADLLTLIEYQAGRGDAALAQNILDQYEYEYGADAIADALNHIVLDYMWVPSENPTAAPMSFVDVLADLSDEGEGAYETPEGLPEAHLHIEFLAIPTRQALPQQRRQAGYIRQELQRRRRSTGYYVFPRYRMQGGYPSYQWLEAIGGGYNPGPLEPMDQTRNIPLRPGQRWQTRKRPYFPNTSGRRGRRYL